LKSRGGFGPLVEGAMLLFQRVFDLQFHGNLILTRRRSAFGPEISGFHQLHHELISQKSLKQRNRWRKKKKGEFPKLKLIETLDLSCLRFKGRLVLKTLTRNPDIGKSWSS
jgi:hypothetical protein